MKRVTLTPEELRFAASVGVDHVIERIVKERRNTFGRPDGLKFDFAICGMFAELAVAKLLSIDWPSPGFRFDVGEYQVRSTERENGCLILHREHFPDGTPYDRDDDLFILVVGKAPTFDVIGFIRGKDGKRKEFWKRLIRRPAFFVPQEALTPIELLERERGRDV